MRVALDHPLYLAMLQDTTRLMLFVELDFIGGFLRFNSGPENINVDFGGGSVVFFGNSLMGEISNFEESTDVAAKGIQLSVMGQGTGFYEEIMSERYRNRPVRVWVAEVNEDFTAVEAGAYYMLNEYRMDTIETSDSMGDNGGFKITLNCESELVDLFGTSDVRYTDADQRSIHPDDTIFEFIGALPGRQIPWGKDDISTYSGAVKYGRGIWTWRG